MRTHVEVLYSMPRGELGALAEAVGSRSCEPGALAVFDQADLVLAALRCDLLVQVTRLVGRPIQVYAPTSRALLGGPRGVPVIDSRGPDDRRVRECARNPRLPTTPAFHRFRLFRPGITIREFLARGGRRSDVRLALKKRWIKLED